MSKRLKKRLKEGFAASFEGTEIAITEIGEWQDADPINRVAIVRLIDFSGDGVFITERNFCDESRLVDAVDLLVNDKYDGLHEAITRVIKL